MSRLVMALVAVALCVLAAPVYAVELSTDVLILGGGVAGQAAARELSLHGKEFLIVEARGVLGGRMQPFRFGKGEYVMEQGPNWIQGLTGNIVWKWKQTYGLFGVTVPGSEQNNTGLTVFYSNGTLVPTITLNTAVHMLDKAYACVVGYANYSDVDQPLRQTLTQCGWTAETTVQSALEWRKTDADFDLTPEVLSTIYTLPDNVYIWYQNADYFVADQNPRGFQKVLQWSIVDNVDPRVHLNETVVGIDWDCSKDNVTVSTSGGLNITANKVIVTFSVGALQHTYQSLFKPQVPLAKAIGIDKAVMGHFTKIHLQFTKPFWPNHLRKWLIADPLRGYLIEWHNLNHKTLLPGSGILMTFVTGPYSRVFEKYTNSVAQKLVMKKLRKAFGMNVPNPTAFHMTRWAEDPYTYGSYSAWKYGYTWDQYLDYCAPLCKSKKVYFSGEATCPDLQAYLEGAYWSGVFSAQDILGIANKTTSPCWASLNEF